MERATEFFVLVTGVVIGLSHILQARTWTELYAALSRQGRLGAFANGALHLVTGAAIVTGHGQVWSWPAAVLTLFGWALVVKGAVAFLVPDLALRSMTKAGAGSGWGFVVAGLALLAISGLAAYALWVG
jgi:hypothetical protein